MPEVKMDFIPDDMTDDEIEEVVEEIEEFNQEKDKSQEEIEEGEIQNKKIPKAKSKRDEMNVNEIFNMPDPPTFGAEQETPKLTKKGKPRKKRPPMSEEHKKKLALAREKAMEARKKKAQEKKEAKELEKEEKELLKKQKVKRVKQLKEEVEDGTEGAIIDPPHMKESQRVGVTVFSKKDLEEAQLEAIIKYDKLRKERKKDKLEKQKKEAEEEAIRQQLRRAVAPPQEYNPFSGCY